jgi:hypothetical protein
MAVFSVFVLVVVVLVHHAASSPSFLFDQQQNSPAGGQHLLAKKSFQDMKCKGMYEKTMFAKLENVCEGCHRLYQDLDIPTLCRYSSTYRYV